MVIKYMSDVSPSSFPGLGAMATVKFFVLRKSIDSFLTPDVSCGTPNMMNLVLSGLINSWFRQHQFALRRRS